MIKKKQENIKNFPKKAFNKNQPLVKQPKKGFNKKELLAKQHEKKKKFLKQSKVEEKKKTTIDEPNMQILAFQKRLLRTSSKGNVGMKLVFNRIEINWIFNKLVNCIMKDGKKETVEKTFINYLTTKNKFGKKINKPKQLLTFLLCSITMYRPILSFDKKCLSKKKKKKKKIEDSKKGIGKKKKKEILIPNLMSVRRQYGIALSWIAKAIRNYGKETKEKIIQKKKFKQKKFKNKKLKHKRFEEKKRKKVVISLEKKIRFMLNMLHKKKKKESFFWTKVKTYSLLLNKHKNSVKGRWR